jgi:hypothetical protein
MEVWIEIIGGIGLAISGLIAAGRMRRRMKRSLGRRVSDLDLVSYKTWNQVERAEQQNAESGPIHPK